MTPDLKQRIENEYNITLIGRNYIEGFYNKQPVKLVTLQRKYKLPDEIVKLELEIKEALGRRWALHTKHPH